ncbi:class I glutamine amidotransferase-like protein [Parathielavia hyrcaniae]|uniref:Class I glutamine amidotransferase-like protein n=1 Tax=Parathielavia hyrcaniae TaxID=113614 RepID=A0AAN6PWY4_9PEZI|nr:class I glutamine amidotransferase-like protein [Parathielavia hyrcaniae]
MSEPFKILIFSRTTAYRHKSIPPSIRALHRLASASGSGPHPFTADDTEDASVFTPASLAAYRVIVLLQCSGEMLDDDGQLDALKGFVRSGGGVVAVHCASFAMPSSEWYGRLIGAVFDNHPAPQPGRVRTLDPEHPIMTCRRLLDESHYERGDDEMTAGVVERTWVDEWYNFKAHPRRATPDGGLHVLLAVDEKSYEGGVHGDDHPVAWCQSFDGGRCFYTSLGHFDEAYEDDWFMGQILGGILWAAEA